MWVPPTPPRTSPKAPKRVYTDEEKDFLKCTTSSTHYAPVHRPRPESITDDDIIAAINANRRRCSLGPIDTEPNWNKATLSANPVHPPASRYPEASPSALASRYPEASASGLSSAAQEEGASAAGVSTSRTPTTLPTLQAVAAPHLPLATGHLPLALLPNLGRRGRSLPPSCHYPRSLLLARARKIGYSYLGTVSLACGERNPSPEPRYARSMLL